jgi:hypothetical protein
MTTIPGVSTTAGVLVKFQSDLARRQKETATFSNFNLYSQILDVFENCHKSGWAGDGSRPVIRETLKIATALVESLPLAYRTPAISGEPDGNIFLEWYVNPRRLLNVSIASDGTLSWAAYIGDEDPRGSCHFYNRVPDTLEYWIGRVCN